MPLPPKHTSGNRALIERLAGHVAHLLNAGVDGRVEVSPAALDVKLTALLSGQGRKGAEYRDGLLGFQLAGAGREPAELAQVYLDLVLNRRLMLAGAKERHVAHDLFVLLCRRGAADSWAESEFVRSNVHPLPKSREVPADFRSVADRLARISNELMPRNPAKRKRDAKGPLLLTAGPAKAEVADELPAWTAILSSPYWQKQLSPGAPFNELASLVIKAFESANTHYGALLRLGLSPFDWMDTLTINTAKDASSFLTSVKAKAAQGRSRSADP